MVLQSCRSAECWDDCRRIVIITLLVVLFADLIVGRSSSRWVPYVALAGLLGSLIALYFQRDANPVSFLGALMVTPSVLCCVASLPVCCRTILMSIRYIEQAHGFG